MLSEASLFREIGGCEDAHGDLPMLEGRHIYGIVGDGGDDDEDQ